MTFVLREGHNLEPTLPWLQLWVLKLVKSMTEAWTQDAAYPGPFCEGAVCKVNILLL